MGHQLSLDTFEYVPDSAERTGNLVYFLSVSSQFSGALVCDVEESISILAGLRGLLILRVYAESGDTGIESLAVRSGASVPFSERVSILL